MKGLNPGVISKVIQLTLTLKMTIAQVVETSVSVNNNSPIQDYVHPDDQTQPTFERKIVLKKRDQKRYKDTENGVDGSRTRLICMFKQLLDHCTTVIHINLDFLRLLCGLQNSNSPKNEHCKNFLEEMQSLFPLLRP